MNFGLLRAIALTIWCLVALFQTVGARAEDNFTAVPAGGLSFAPDPELDFVSETLILGPDRIQASYNISNPTTHDRKILISFRLPELDMADTGTGQIRLADRNSINFVNFNVSIDEHALDTIFDQRATALGLDVTDILGDAGIPLGPDISVVKAKIAQLPDEKKVELTERGILQVEDGIIKPAWTLKTTIYWQQKFKASSVVEITMKYQPVISETSFTPEKLDTLSEDYCVSNEIADAISARASRGGGAPRMTGVVYSITQGAHWNKPTLLFQLVIEKKDASSIVSTCIEKLSKINVLQMEKMAEKYSPEGDLSVLFVR